MSNQEQDQTEPKLPHSKYPGAHGYKVNHEGVEYPSVAAFARVHGLGATTRRFKEGHSPAQILAWARKYPKHLRKQPYRGKWGSFDELRGIIEDCKRLGKI